MGRYLVKIVQLVCMHQIAKTGFHVSLISYGLFWLLDVLRPGFVSRSFSVHLFLLAALIFGLWWGIQVKEFTDRPWVQLVVVGILGILFAVLTWFSGSGLGTLRVLITLISLFIPVIFWNLIRK